MRKQKKNKQQNKQLLVFFFAIILLAVALSLDSQIMSLVSLIKTPFLNTIFSWIFFVEKEIIFYPLIIFSTTIILLLKDKRKIVLYGLNLIIIAIIGLTLKFVVARPRPNLSSNHSFPSGHSALLFASLPFLKSKGLCLAWFILSCVFVSARIWMGMHYPSDIIAGAILGYYIPLLVQKIAIRLSKESKN